MLKKAFFSLVIFIIALFALIGTSNKVQAQTIGIKISPTKIEDNVDPGQVLQKAIKVRNNSNIATTFYIYLKDFKAGDESGAPILVVPGTEKGYFLASWIEITSEGINFEPGEEKTIPFIVRVPDEIGPGGYFGGVYIGTEPPRLQLDSEDKGAGMAVAQQTGSLLLLRVKGDVFEEARVREFTTDKDVYSTPVKTDFLIRIENIGNVHIKPVGMIKITNMFGRETDSIMVNETGGNVLPKSIRRFTTNWEVGNGFGRYKAELGMTYGTKPELGGQGMRSLVQAAYFWIIPWRIIIPLMLGLIIVISVVILMLKLYKNKAVQKAMEQAGLGQVRLVRKFQGPSPILHVSIILLVIFIVLFLILIAIYFIFFA